MKSFSLSRKIGLLFTALLLMLFLILSLVFRWSIRDFFTSEAYSTIEYAQEMKLQEFKGDFIPDRTNFDDFENVRDVGHIIILDHRFDLIDNFLERLESFSESNEMAGDPRPGVKPEFDTENEEIMVIGFISPDIVTLMEKIKEDTPVIKGDEGRYELKIKDKNLFYVVRDTQIGGESVTIISYMWDTYKNTLSNTLFSRLVLVMALLILASLVVVIVFSKYLTNPLKKLSEYVKSISRRNWDKPIVLNRKDEIGELAKSIEKMRKSLSEQDKEQQSTLQFISHELKTPVMVIRSYAQAIKDGIHPGGDLDSAVDVIDKEIQRMDLKIKDLLFITGLEYLSRHHFETEKIDLSSVVNDVVSRLSYQRNDINLDLKLINVNAMINEGQLSVAIENILTNQLRYAKSKIEISMDTVHKNSMVKLRFANDGEKIDEDKLVNLFKPFEKSVSGENGLGLYIAKKIIELHGGEIEIKNEESFVATVIKIPVLPDTD
jgi:two-component system sensor histidine kinase CssS